MAMDKGGLGTTYHDGEIIVRQGDKGDRMFVIQKGRAQILVEKDGEETPIRVAEEGELIGEMAIFERDLRSATVRAQGEVRVLTVDKKNFLKRIHEDPSLAFRVVQTMSRRIRELSDDLARLKGKRSQD
jgi:CRP/FNR family cyclic AMP-dependent transcriptional regulator